MTEAAKLISDVFSSTLRFVRPGITELDISAEIEFAMKKRGATGPSFETIVASGAAIGLGSCPAYVQTPQEKRVGRAGPGCYTPRLLQRYDAHRVCGAVISEGAADVWRRPGGAAGGQGRDTAGRGGWMRWMPRRGRC